MLQQTTVATVGPYFKKFLERWPTVDTLASATLDQVLVAWAGLGYYARARNLHKCAGIVSRDLGGAFPNHEKDLLELPGVGRYTAAAIAAIAFDRPAAVMDGNVERVMARIFEVMEPLPDAKSELYEHTASLTPNNRPGDYAQAVMDLGATVCTVRKPKCMLCPWASLCDGRSIAETLPQKRAKAQKPTRRGTALWLVRGDGAILLRRRPEKGLLGGMMEFPSTPWQEQPPPVDAALVATDGRFVAGRVVHVFTHFRLELKILVDVAPEDGLQGIWVRPEAFADYALPTVMKKVAASVVAQEP